MTEKSSAAPPPYKYIGAAVAPRGEKHKCGKHLQNESAPKAADALLVWSVPNPHHAATPHLAPLAGRKASGADRPDDQAKLIASK